MKIKIIPEYGIREGEKTASRFNSGRILGGTNDEC